MAKLSCRESSILGLGNRHESKLLAMTSYRPADVPTKVVKAIHVDDGVIPQHGEMSQGRRPGVYIPIPLRDLPAPDRQKLLWPIVCALKKVAVGQPQVVAWIVIHNDIVVVD